MLKAVLFDLDDTLIDWGDLHTNDQFELIEQAHLENVYRYLQTLATPTVDAEGFRKEYFRIASAQWFTANETLDAPHMGRVLVKAAQQIGIPADLLNEHDCLRVYDWGAFEAVRVFEDVPPVLTLLRQHGLAMGIITNAFQPMWMRDIEIAQLGLLDYFPHCRFSAADVGYLKPSREIFEQALQAVNAAPDEAVFIGDNLMADIYGAQQAGMRAILRAKTGRTQSRPEVTPDAVIQTFAELPTLLETWFGVEWRG